MTLLQDQTYLGKENDEPRIIGGMFGLSFLNFSTENQPSFINNQSLLLVNASSGLFLVIKSLKPSQIWLPSYLCSSIIKTVNHAQTNILFYEVDYDLNIINWDWLSQIKKNDLVILIAYFGLPINHALTTEIKNKGGIVLEDASQSLLSYNINKNSDFVLFSPRKFLGIPDGGILNCNYKFNFTEIELQSPPQDWWLKSLSATILRREFDIYGGERHWYQLFQATELNYPIGYYSMSELSQNLLENTFNYEQISQRRIHNYQILQGQLAEIALFKELPSGVTPLGFPIRIKKREALRQLLFAHEIYPPIHWLIQDVVPDKFRGSHLLSREIMTLPCDQRYNNDAMEKIASLVKNFLSNY